MVPREPNRGKLCGETKPSFHLLRDLERRRAGFLRPHCFREQFTALTFRNLDLSSWRDLDQNSHTAAVNSLSLDPDEARYLLAGLRDGTLALHDLQARNSSNVILRIGRTNRHKHSHAIQTVSWFTDNGLFLTSGRDGKLKVWDPNTQLPIEEFTVGEKVNKHAVGSADISGLVAVTNTTNHVTLVDLKSGSTSHMLRGHSGEVVSCAWALHQPSILATGAADSKVILWDVRQARSYLDYLDYNNVRYKSKKDLKLAGSSHQGCVQGLAFSSCGRYLISVGSDRRIRKWDTMSLKNLKTKFPDLRPGTRSNSSSGGSNLVDLTITTGTASDLICIPEHNKILMFDIIKGTRVKELVGHHSRVLSLCCNAAELCLYSGGQDKFVLQWDARPPAASLIEGVEGEEKKETGKINQYTVDTWSSSEED